MRSIRLILLLFFTTQSFASWSQTKADSISLTFPKVLIVNDKKQVLLTFDRNRKAYEVPSIGALSGPVDFDSYIKKASDVIGIINDSYRLGGLFTYIFPNQYNTFIRPYFVVKFKAYANGHSFNDSSYKWFSFKDAVSAIPYPASSKIVEKILSKPKTVWAATFQEYGYTNPVDTTKIKFKILTDFYRLN
jgi:hypothetical protein